MLETVDLDVRLSEEEYWDGVRAAQLKLRQQLFRMYRQGSLSAICLFEGWDAAGKGGAIKRITEGLDPRGYEVFTFAAPAGDEAHHHYLWRFWRAVPSLGRLAIFDRSHYGRVLVERVEKFCSKDEWRRAYREINEWEGQLVTSGCLVLKFWLHISKEEQLTRFKSRERDPYRSYKLTEEDWRNRARWDEYLEAVEQMLRRTSTARAPWTVVEADDKWFARVKVVSTIADRLEAALDDLEKGKNRGRNGLTSNGNGGKKRGKGRNG
ncbi:MAG: polyphosphate kinase 2 family protein [Planctomycetota bacterium]|jgi:polyphosphate kinase 2 (PPK2 family)